MTTPPYHDTPAVPMCLAAGHLLLCQEQSLASAIATELCARAVLLRARDPTTGLAPNARGEPPPPGTDSRLSTSCHWGRSAPVRCSAPLRSRPCTGTSPAGCPHRYKENRNYVVVSTESRTGDPRTAFRGTCNNYVS